MSFATRVLLGLALGVGVGLFFGEYVAFLGPVGDAFILLLQMTVLPYIAVSLAHGLGSVSASDAANLAKRAGGFLLVLWGLSLASVFLAPLAFPDWESASFFSSNMVARRDDFAFLDLFIPANPFHALAESVVPAVVVFSLALGAALIGISGEGKQTLLDVLATLGEALSRITGFVVKLAPYGVFAIAAHAGGTLSVEEAQGLWVFAAVYVALALVLTFWTLPALVTTLTPFHYRDVVWFTRDALVTCFATGNMFVVLSVLAEKSKELLRVQLRDEQGQDSLVDVVVPTSFTFPSAGKLLTLSFIFFAGWLTGYAISVSQYPAFLATGLAAFFGNTMVAVPFLLDLFQIPADAFQLFVVVDNIVGNRFGATLAAMHTLALVLLSASSTAGLIRVRAVAVARYLVITLVLTLAAVAGVRFAFEVGGHSYEGYTTFVGLEPKFEPLQVRTLDAPPKPLPEEDRSVPGLDRIRRRGFLRVGYFQDSLPFAFRNDKNQVVGFDIELAHMLAGELGVGLEIVQVDKDELPRLLDAGYLDTAMSALLLTTDRLGRMAFSAPYLDQTLGFLVADHRREDFSSSEAVQQLESPRIGVLDIPYFVNKLRRYLPDAEVVKLSSPRDFLRDESGELDAMLYSAESGSAWSLVYPQFSVAIPHPDVVSAPLAYPVARGEDEMVEFLSSWVELKRKEGTINALYEHWVLGQAAKAHGPRWSVIRDVLGWVE
jgi:Na+/H+-dicarboxylate symporter